MGKGLFGSGPGKSYQVCVFSAAAATAMGQEDARRRGVPRDQPLPFIELCSN